MDKKHSILYTLVAFIVITFTLQACQNQQCMCCNRPVYTITGTKDTLSIYVVTFSSTWATDSLNRYQNLGYTCRLDSAPVYPTQGYCGPQEEQAAHDSGYLCIPSKRGGMGGTPCD
jgi:hypothetical protein